MSAPDGFAGRLQQVELDDLGDWMFSLMERLFPICRSITGDGVRETLAIINDEIPLVAHEVPTGTEVLDWVIPNEWNIRDAYVKDQSGKKVIDFTESNLHVLGYSTPIETTMSLSELKNHLHSMPEYPEWIPFRTSYFTEAWGFSVADRVLRQLPEGEYEVRIDSDLEPGSLTYGEVFLPGAESGEILISAHVCHPSMCNDNLSGVVVAAALARLLASVPRRYSYRIVFAPGTIGAITWLARNEHHVHRIRHGLIAANLGDGGDFVYKKTRRGNTEVDAAVMHALSYATASHRIIEFSPYGYDERQYCSPGFNLPVGSLTRTPFAQYPEYHTSADDLSLVSAPNLAESFNLYLEVLRILEGNQTLVNTSPKGEPQLGRRGLYRTLGHGSDKREAELALLWVLNMSDGDHSLLEIAELAGLPFGAIRASADTLLDAGLLVSLNGRPESSA